MYGRFEQFNSISTDNFGENMVMVRERLMLGEAEIKFKRI